MPAVIPLIPALVSTGVAIYGAVESNKAADSFPRTTAPAPSGSATYDASGRLTSTQVYDPGTNTWVSRTGNIEPPKPGGEWATAITGNLSKDQANPAVWTELDKRFKEYAYQDSETAAKNPWAVMQFNYQNMLASKDRVAAQYKTDYAKWQTDYADWQKQTATDKSNDQKLTSLRTQYLDNLNAAPADRQAQYDAYQKAYSDAVHRDVDPRFAQINRTADESANATGMFGSRAYADTKGQIAQDQMYSNNDIANQAVLAKEQLANTDRTFWANMLNQIDSGARADAITSAQLVKNNADIGSMGYANLMAQYGANSNQRLTEWQNRQARSASQTGSISNLAGGLLYLYGKGGSGGGSGGGADFSGGYQHGAVGNYLNT